MGKAFQGYGKPCGHVLATIIWGPGTRNYISGMQPMLAGKEEYGTQMEKAMQAVEEWGVPETQKKQRITESLKSPTAEAVRNLKFSQESSVAYDLLPRIAGSVGQTKTTSCLIYQFEHMYQ